MKSHCYVLIKRPTGSKIDGRLHQIKLEFRRRIRKGKSLAYIYGKLKKAGLDWKKLSSYNYGPWWREINTRIRELDCKFEEVELVTKELQWIKVISNNFIEGEVK